MGSDLLQEVAGRLSREVEQIRDLLQIVGYGRVVPALGRMPSQSRRKGHGSKTGSAGSLQIRPRIGQQTRKLPTCNQACLQHRQIDVEDLSLRDGRT